jgi:hypothetical protein
MRHEKHEFFEIGGILLKREEIPKLWVTLRSELCLSPEKADRRGLGVNHRGSVDEALPPPAGRQVVHARNFPLPPFGFAQSTNGAVDIIRSGVSVSAKAGSELALDSHLKRRDAGSRPLRSAQCALTVSLTELGTLSDAAVSLALPRDASLTQCDLTPITTATATAPHTHTDKISDSGPHRFSFGVFNTSTDSTSRNRRRADGIVEDGDIRIQNKESVLDADLLLPTAGSANPRPGNDAQSSGTVVRGGDTGRAR